MLFQGLASRRGRTALVCCAALAALLVVGCGPSKALRTISGTVTLDGEPVPAGSIQFLPTGEGTPEGANITAGKYTAEVSPGKLKVKIYAPQEHPTETVPGPDPSGPRVPKTVETIPAKYNESTTLEITVTRGGETHDFELKSSDG